MGKTRLEAFSDGVLAIIITIMVLEIKVPHGSDFEALKPFLPVLLGYALSFVYIAIYWNNHHHMFALAKKINGRVMWANAHLLFWLSLVPVVTSWVGETRSAPVPTSLYGVVLFMAGISYLILQRALVAIEGKRSAILKAVGRDLRGKASAVLYLVAIAVAYRWPYAADVIYAGVALMWLVPDSRIEKIANENPE